MMTSQEQYNLVVDAWMREAQEASRLVEDIEGRTKNKDLAQENRLKDSGQSKLFQVGVKLDQLESLLHNPPSKPFLTKEDLEFRWNMLSDLRLKTKTLAQSLYTSRPTKRTGGSLAATTKESTRTSSSSGQGTTPQSNPDQEHEPPAKPYSRICNFTEEKHAHSVIKIKTSLSKDNPELLIPLISEDATQSQVQHVKKSDSVIWTSLIKKAGWTICLILGAAAFLLILIFLCTII